MNRVLLTPGWLIPAAVCVLVYAVLMGGSARAQTATTPATPAIASLTPSDQAITVVWTAPASDGGSVITSYDLRYINSDATDKADTNWTDELNVWNSGALQATITGLTNGTSYDVQARAANANGNGAWSATVSGKAATVPTAPRLAYAVPRSGQIIITWSSPVSDGGSEITSYDLRYIRSDTEDSVYLNWTFREDFSQGAGSYRIRGLTNGVAYHVQVRAINAAGAGPWFERVTRTPTGPPGIPSIDTVTSSDESLTITWSPPASDGGAAITRYNLRYVREDLVAGNFLFVWNHESGIWTSGDLEYTLSGLDDGVRYRLGLQAVNAKGSSGWSDWSDPRTGVAGIPPELPGAPTIDRAISDGTMVDVTWSAPGSDGGADITSYDLRHIRSDATDKADDNWTVLESAWSSGALTYAVGGLTADVQYDFQLRAVNSAGAGSWSATVVNVDPSPPGAPTIGFFSDETPGQLWIPWFPPADDGGAPVTHYDLRHIRNDATDKADVNWTQVDDLSGTSYTITGLTSDVRYDVQVRAVNRAGDGSWSGTVTASPRPPRPNPPGNISVTPSDGTLTVSWSAAPPKSDVTVAGYKVRYIRTDHPGSGEPRNWTTSDLIPSGTLQYAITGLENGVWYSIDAYSVSSADRTSPPPPDALPVHSPGRVPAALGELKRILTAESSIFISWIGPSDNGGHTVTSYDVHHHRTSDPTNVARSSEGARDIVEGLSATNVTWVGNLTPHVEYEIRVRARNRIGAGPWSSLTLIPRARPVDLTVDSLTPGDGALTVSWTDGGDDEITGYELRYIDYIPSSVAPDSTEWNYIRNITGTSPLTHTIDELQHGVAYIIQLRGKNRYGDTPGELPSDWGRWKPGACCWLYETPRTTPDAPGTPSATPGDRMLTVDWSAPAEDGGSDITSYDLRYIRSDAQDKSDASWTERDGVWSSGALRYPLSGLTNGVEYDVQVRAVNAVGEGPWSLAHTDTPLTTPGAPSIESVTPGDDALTVVWSAPASDGGRDITAYDLRYIRSDAPDKADANWTEQYSIWASGALRYPLSGLTNGVEYDVQVRAVNALGGGSWSGTGAGTPLTTPGAPTIDSLTPGDETITVAWSAPADTGGSEVTGYDLRYIRSDATDNNWTVRDSAWTSGALRYPLSGLTNGVEYEVQIRAVNEAGDGQWSGTISGAPQTIPAAPTIDSATPRDETLTIAWSAPADTGGHEVTDYDLRYIRSDATDNNWTVQDSAWTSGPLSDDLDGLTNGVRYDVQLRAVTDVGTGPWSATASATPRTAPAAPAINLITVGDGALAVSWSAPSDSGGSTITSYDVRYIRSDALDKSDDASWTERDGIWTSGVLRSTLSSLTNGVGYDVQVRAVNGAGEGAWSATASATPQTVADAPPINLITPGDGALAVSWSAPSDDGGSAITSYDVRYIRSDALDRADDNWIVEFNAWTSGPLSYDLAGLTNGVGYDVQVRAVNDAGDGPWSATSTDTPRTTPGAPTIDVITPGSYALLLTWSAPAEDGGFAVTSYDVRYIPSDATDRADGNWTVREHIWSSGRLRYGLNEATGFDLGSGVQYDVQVRAVNTVAAGPWSAIRTGTPRKPATVTVSSAPAPLVVTRGDVTPRLEDPREGDVPFTGTYTVALDTQPTGDVTVTINSDNLDVAVMPESLTFTTLDWNQPKTVTVTAAGDADATDDKATLTHGASGSDYAGSATITVTVTDLDDPPNPTTGGVGGFVGGGGGGGGPSPSTLDFEWTVEHDIEALDPTHDTPTGAWSDGRTLWLAHNGDGAADALYAYDLESGERVSEREFELDGANRAPRGVWSDRTIKILWVSDSGQDKLFAHDLESGERLPERDIALAERNADPRGIWSDGATMWVLDGVRNALFAYDLASGDPLAECALDAANDDPRGLWSDGVTVWVSDHIAKRLFAYRLPVLPDAEADAAEDDADEGDKEVERVRDEEFRELSKASNNSPRGLWSDGDVMYVADESDGRVYSYNMPDAIDARLASLTLSGVDIGEFDSAREDYTGAPDEGVTETTVEATAAQSRAVVVIDPPDADGDEENGDQAALGGLGEITVTVTSADGSRTRVYVVRLGDPEQEATPEPWPHCLRGDVDPGFSLVLYEGGSVEELEDCAEGRHVSALYATHDGAFVPHILGAPSFVNRSFRELYAAGVPPITLLLAKSDGPATAEPGAGGPPGGGAPEPWPHCLRGDVAEGFALVLYEGGGVEDLAACARGRGVTALYALDDGAFVPHILGAPAFVNRDFGELFADGLPAATPLLARSEAPLEAN